MRLSTALSLRTRLAAIDLAREPMASDLKPSRFPRASPGRHAANKPSKAAKEPSKRAGDLWLLWLLALGSIAAPVIVLLCAYSIPKGNVSWQGVYIAVKRGEFLLPVMFLCVETVRCWWREAGRGSRLRHFIRTLATGTCVVASLVCVCATTIGTLVPVTAETGHSIATVTVGCFCVALVFGTVAVWVSTRRGGY
jgi:hypothetical protein